MLSLRILKIAVFLFIIYSRAFAQTVYITEFLFMPLSGLPEWVEIYNAGDSPAILSGWKLGDAISVKTLPPCTLEAGAFAVLCQNPSTFADTLCAGALLLQPSGWSVLNNDADLVRLLDETDSLRHSISYTSAQFGGCMTYGVSAEATTIGGSEIACCPSGSTPGCANASWPLLRDLRLDSLSVEVNPVTSPPAVITAFISNAGTEAFSGGRAFLFESHEPTSPLDSADLPNIQPEGSLSIELRASLSNGRYEMLVILSEDDNPTNNSASIDLLFGPSGWPICVTEFLFMPAVGLPEWIEIYNDSDEPVDLTGWRFGDEVSLKSIPPCTLNAGTFAVLCQDTAAFVDSICEGAVLLQPSSWPALNNDQDLIRLIDSSDIERQSISYTALEFGGCMSAGISAEVVTIGEVNFVCSPSGSTPGCSNAIWARPEGDRTIEIDPNPFDPSVGPTTIGISLPAGGIEVKIYDRIGFVRRTLSTASSPAGFNLIWDGLDDSGKALPAGIYIILANDSAGNSVKEAVAIIGGRR